MIEYVRLNIYRIQTTTKKIEKIIYIEENNINNMHKAKI